MLEAGGGGRGPGRTPSPKSTNRPRTGAANTCGTLSSSKKHSPSSSPCCRSPAATSAACRAPLFSLQVQLWIREVSCVLRSVRPDRRFPMARQRTRRPNARRQRTRLRQHPDLELPATYCRRCGVSGWMAMRSPLSTKLRTGPATIYQAAVNRSEIVTLLRANPNVPGVVHLNPTNHELEPAPTDDSVPVLITTTEDDAKNSVCPACGEREAIRFLGTAVASLASVSLSTLAGSDQVDNDQRKLDRLHRLRPRRLTPRRLLLRPHLPLQPPIADGRSRQRRRRNSPVGPRHPRPRPPPPMHSTATASVPPT